MYFEAIFQPSNEGQYNSDAKRIIGKRIAVQDGWILEDGPHKGQQGYYIPKSTMGVIPACDLKEIRNIPYAKWKEIFKSVELG
jgi:hypothetical protein